MPDRRTRAQQTSDMLGIAVYLLPDGTIAQHPHPILRGDLIEPKMSSAPAPHGGLDLTKLKTPAA
jgi:hypothetical protein